MHHDKMKHVTLIATSSKNLESGVSWSFVHHYCQQVFSWQRFPFKDSHGNNFNWSEFRRMLQMMGIYKPATGEGRLFNK